MSRNHEPRQLQAKNLDAVVKYRMPHPVSGYEYLVDRIDTLYELPRRDLTISPSAKKERKT
jgi:hypothetical protein